MEWVKKCDKWREEMAGVRGERKERESAIFKLKLRKKCNALSTLFLPLSKSDSPSTEIASRFAIPYSL